MLRYTAHGLGIHSAVALPELPSGAATADVVIREGPLGAPPAPRPPGAVVRVTSREIVLAWPGVGAIAVRDGRELVLDPAPDAPPELVRLCLLGPALAVLLHQRGRLVLHASAVATPAGAVAFVGCPGDGKSTTAAALVVRGAPLVTDDVLAVEARTGTPLCVFPGIPELRLWPEAAGALGDAGHRLPRVHPGIEKRAWRATAAFAPGPLPVARIYVLADGEDAAIEPLELQERFATLARHAYCGRLVPRTEPARHLQQCARVATDVPVRRLRRPRSLARLVDLARLVEADAP